MKTMDKIPFLHTPITALLVAELDKDTPKKSTVFRCLLAGADLYGTTEKNESVLYAIVARCPYEDVTNLWLQRAGDLSQLTPKKSNPIVDVLNCTTQPDGYRTKIIEQLIKQGASLKSVPLNKPIKDFVAERFPSMPEKVAMLLEYGAISKPLKNI